MKGLLDNCGQTPPQAGKEPLQSRDTAAKLETASDAVTAGG